MLFSFQEFRAFELLRSGLDRSKYLMIKEAKIIAMTCTHAALKRHDLVNMNFQVCRQMIVIYKYCLVMSSEKNCIKWLMTAPHNKNIDEMGKPPT